MILYELLTGLRPIDARRLKNAAPTEMIRIIREEEPSKPSTRLSTDGSLPSMAALRQTEPRKLMALLRGELDWVVMKCLEKHRERRYETANALARDIQRYLADEAVEARPPSAGYRFSKFLRRHRGPVLAASLVLLALVGGIAGTTFGMIRAEHRRVEADAARGREAKRAEGERLAREQESVQRAKAENARHRTRQALDAMTSSVTGNSLTTQKEISDEQKKFLTEVLTYYQEFAGEKADDEPSRARTAAAAFRVGLIEGRLGRTAEAAAAYRTALDAYVKLHAEFPAAPLYRNELAGSHINLGILLGDLGMRPAAEAQYRKALPILEKVVADFPAVPLYRHYLANNHDNLGILLRDLRKGPEAEEQYRKAISIREKLAADFPTVPEYHAGLAMSHNNLGRLLTGLGKRPEAEEQHRKALAIQEKLAAEFPTVPEYRDDLAVSQNNLGILLADLEKRPEAEEQYRKALAIQDKLVAEFPAVPSYRWSLAASHVNLGNLLAGLGKAPEAEEQYRRALAIEQKVVAEFPAVPLYRRDLARSHRNLGLILEGVRKWPEAEQQYRKAMAIQEKLVAEFPAVPEYRQDLAAIHNNLGLLLAGLGKAPEAEEQYRKADALDEKLVAEFPAVPAHRGALAGSQVNLGILLAGLGKAPEAEEQYRNALAVKQKLAADFPAVPEYREDLAASHSNLGLLLAGLGNAPEAEEQYRKALAIDQKLVAEFLAVPEHRSDLAHSHTGLGLLLASLGKRPEAEEQYRKALSIKEKLVAEFPAVPQYRVDLGGSYCNFGILVRNSGQPGESLEWFEKAIRTLTPVYEEERQLGMARDFLRNSHFSRAMAYDRLRKFPEAIKDWDKAIELSPMAEQSSFRAARATSRVQAGQVAEAVAEVAELTKNPTWNSVRCRLRDFASAVLRCRCWGGQDRRQAASVCRPGDGPAANCSEGRLQRRRTYGQGHGSGPHSGTRGLQEADRGVGEEIAGQTGAETMTEEKLLQEALSRAPEDRSIRPGFHASVCSRIMRIHESSGLGVRSGRSNPA